MQHDNNRPDLVFTVDPDSKVINVKFNTPISEWLLTLGWRMDIQREFLNVCVWQTLARKKQLLDNYKAGKPKLLDLREEDKIVPTPRFFSSDIHALSAYMRNMGVMPSFKFKPIISLKELNLLFATNAYALRMEERFKGKSEEFVLFSQANVLATQDLYIASPDPEDPHERKSKLDGLCVGYSLSKPPKDQFYNSYYIQQAVFFESRFQKKMSKMEGENPMDTENLFHAQVAEIAKLDKDGKCDGTHKQIPPKEFASTVKRMTNSFTKEASIYIRKEGPYIPIPKKGISEESPGFKPFSHLFRLSVDGRGNCSFFDSCGGLALAKCEKDFLDAVADHLRNEPREISKDADLTLAMSEVPRLK